MIALALLLSVAEAKKPKPVTFTFAFRDGDAAVSTVQQTESRVATGAPVHRADTTETLRWEVRTAADGVAVKETVADVAQVVWKDGVEQPKDPVYSGLLDALSSIDTDMLIGADGAWKGLVDDAVYRHGIETATSEFFATLLARIPDPDKRARAEGVLATLKQAVSADTAVEQAHADWQWETEFWAGRTFLVGEETHDAFTITHPITGDVLPRTAKFGVTAVGPCRKGAKSPTCADVYLDFTTEPEALAVSARKVALRQVPEGASVDVSVEVAQTEHRVGRLEVDTLRPWSWTIEETNHSVTTAGPEQYVSDSTKVHTQTWTWTEAQ